MGSPRYPSLYQINTRVWLTELSRNLGRPAAHANRVNPKEESRGEPRKTKSRTVREELCGRLWTTGPKQSSFEWCNIRHVPANRGKPETKSPGVLWASGLISKQLLATPVQRLRLSRAGLGWREAHKK